MNPTELVRRATVLLAFQHAMVGKVFPSLRGLTVEWPQRAIHAIAYVAGPPSPQELNGLACIQSELEAQFAPYMGVRIDVVRSVPPEPMAVLSEWVYRRMEVDDALGDGPTRSRPGDR
jgi:hypothetical protein